MLEVATCRPQCPAPLCQAGALGGMQTQRGSEGQRTSRLVRSDTARLACFPAGLFARHWHACSFFTATSSGSFRSACELA